MLLAQANCNAVMVLFRPVRKTSNGVTQVCLRATCSGPTGTGAGGTHSKPDGPLRERGLWSCSIFFFSNSMCWPYLCGLEFDTPTPGKRYITLYATIYFGKDLI